MAAPALIEGALDLGGALLGEEAVAAIGAEVMDSVEYVVGREGTDIIRAGARAAGDAERIIQGAVGRAATAVTDELGITEEVRAARKIVTTVIPRLYKGIKGVLSIFKGARRLVTSSSSSGGSSGGGGGGSATMATHHSSKHLDGGDKEITFKPIEVTKPWVGGRQKTKMGLLSDDVINWKLPDSSMFERLLHPLSLSDPTTAQRNPMHEGSHHALPQHHTLKGYIAERSDQAGSIPGVDANSNHAPILDH